MLSHLLAPAMARRGVHYGWVMVALTFLVSLSSAGALGILGALLLPLQRDFGWDTGAISGALALRLLLFGMIAPFAAALVARRPDRMLWGSDWPHVMCKVPMPNDGDLLDILGDWVPDKRTREAILVHNPARLYGFD